MKNRFLLLTHLLFVIKLLIMTIKKTSQNLIPVKKNTKGIQVNKTTEPIVTKNVVTKKTATVKKEVTPDTTKKAIVKKNTPVIPVIVDNKKKITGKVDQQTKIPKINKKEVTSVKPSLKPIAPAKKVSPTKPEVKNKTPKIVEKKISTPKIIKKSVVSKNVSLAKKALTVSDDITMTINSSPYSDYLLQYRKYLEQNCLMLYDKAEIDNIIKIKSILNKLSTNRESFNGVRLFLFIGLLNNLDKTFSEIRDHYIDRHLDIQQIFRIFRDSIYSSRAFFENAINENETLVEPEFEFKEYPIIMDFYEDFQKYIANCCIYLSQIYERTTK